MAVFSHAVQAGARLVRRGHAPRRSPAAQGVVLIGALVATAPALLLLSPAGAAAADDALTFIPNHGSIISAPFVVTPKGCPAAATTATGTMYGPGLDPSGLVVVPGGSGPVYHDAAFGLPLRLSLIDLQDRAHAKFTGTYQFIVRCTDDKTATTVAQFAGTVTFDRNGNFTGRAPKEPPRYGVPRGALALVFPQFSVPPDTPDPSPAAAAPPSTSASPQATAASPQATAASPQAAGKLTDATTDDLGLPGWPALALAAAVGFALGASAVYAVTSARPAIPPRPSGSPDPPGSGPLGTSRSGERSTSPVKHA